jgi:hypothetical protein
MPFRADFVPHILGTEAPLKTVTRRFAPRHVGTHLRACVPKPGKPPSQWRGFANLEVVSCRSEFLQDIGVGYLDPKRPLWLVRDLVSEVHREGVWSLDDFTSIWRELYGAKPGTRWEDNPPVWRIEFRVEP